MKNIFMYVMFVLGTMLIITGIFNFLPFEIKSNTNFGNAYNLGHNVGYIIGKFIKIILGLLMLKYGYETYLELKIKG